MLDNYQILLDKLPEDCKVFLDCLDLLHSAKMEDVLASLEAKRAELLSMAEKESLKDDYNKKFVDALIDNVSRVDKITSFIKNHFTDGKLTNN